ncbi:hypothetical protein FBU59_004481, partial [Linderina macrospora]
GGSVLKSLHAAGTYTLRAITRNTSSDKVKSLQTKYPGVEWAEADLDDRASLVKAFQGVNIVFGVTQFFQPSVMGKAEEGDTDAEFRQGKNMVDAAIEAKVGSMIYSSLNSMKELSGGKYSGVLHFEGKHKIEEYLNSKAKEIDPFIVYVGYYMENYVDFSRISPEDNRTVEFTMPLLPTTKLPLVDTANDTGVVVRYVIEHPDECRGKPMEISSGYYEAQEMAKVFTEATGKPARYVQIPYEAVGLDDLVQMFKGIVEFGLFGGRTEFLSRGYSAPGSFSTPTQFWKNRNWSGPSTSST